MLRRYQQTGQMESLPRGATVQPQISEKQLDVVRSLVAEQPDALLFELCERYQQRTGVVVSVTTMHALSATLKSGL